MLDCAEIVYSNLLFTWWSLAVKKGMGDEKGERMMEVHLEKGIALLTVLLQWMIALRLDEEEILV